MIGTPQKRWRETHQSGRFSIISYMRSSPQARIHLTLWISSSASWRIDFCRPFAAVSIFLPGIKVVSAVARSGVNDTAALIERDVIGKNAGHLNGKKRVLKLHAIEIAALERGANFGLFDAALGLQGGDAIGGQQ